MGPRICWGRGGIERGLQVPWRALKRGLGCRMRAYNLISPAHPGRFGRFGPRSIALLSSFGDNPMPLPRFGSSLAPYRQSIGVIVKGLTFPCQNGSHKLT